MFSALADIVAVGAALSLPMTQSVAEMLPKQSTAEFFFFRGPLVRRFFSTVLFIAKPLFVSDYPQSILFNIFVVSTEFKNNFSENISRIIAHSARVKRALSLTASSDR